MTKATTSIEKVACTLLKNTIATGSEGNQEIIDAAERVLSSSEIVEWVDELHPNSTKRVFDYNNGIHNGRYWKLYDWAVCDLIEAISRYRFDGRVDEYDAEISKMGNLTMSGSLSADIVDFHSQMLRAASVLFDEC